jgi:hypothetical protein
MVWSPRPVSPWPGDDVALRSRADGAQERGYAADDQSAIVHALRSPSLDIRGLVAAHFGHRRRPNSMKESRAEIDLLVKLLGMQGQVRVEDGASHALPDMRTAVDDGSYDFSREYRPIRVYNTIDSRFVLSDMFAKLRTYAAQKVGGCLPGEPV